MARGDLLRPEEPADEERHGSGNPVWDESPRLRNLTPRQKAGAVVLRDLAVFQVKLILDGLKDLVMIWISIGAATLDLLAPSGPRGRRFYSTMRVAEKFDRWLNLYGASRDAVGEKDGLFGASRAGADSLLGHIEKLVLGHEEPEEPGGRAPGDRRR